jgi:pseudouridine synthase
VSGPRRADGRAAAPQARSTAATGARAGGRQKPAADGKLPRPDAAKPETGAAQAIRLQKIIADAGIASRRAAERLILDGAVTVNGRIVTELGAKAVPGRDDVRVAGQRVAQPAPHVYYLLHKPPGYITTLSDERGRAAARDLLTDVKTRIYPVGRLDRDSEGLLLFTNDGELTTRLTHPRFGIEKEYLALVDREPASAELEALRHGVVIDGRRTAPARVERLHPDGAGVWLAVTIHEGRKHQVRLMCEAVGLTVRRLVRTRFGPLTLEGLPPGAYRRLTPRELARLRRDAGLHE